MKKKSNALLKQAHWYRESIFTELTNLIRRRLSESFCCYNFKKIANIICSLYLRHIFRFISFVFYWQPSIFRLTMIFKLINGLTQKLLWYLAVHHILLLLCRLLAQAGAGRANPLRAAARPAGLVRCAPVHVFGLADWTHDGQGALQVDLVFKARCF